jgi:hypothetical protein
MLLLLSAGQFNDAAYSLVQLRKILEDSSSSSQPGPEMAALQEGAAACERSLEEVSYRQEQQAQATWHHLVGRPVSLPMPMCA